MYGTGNLEDNGIIRLSLLEHRSWNTVNFYWSNFSFLPAMVNELVSIFGIGWQIV